MGTQLPVNIFNHFNHFFNLFFKQHPNHNKDHHHQSQLHPRKPSLKKKKMFQINGTAHTDLGKKWFFAWMFIVLCVIIMQH